MNITKDISPLTEFKRDSARLIAQIKETGRPQILTVNGKPSVVVMDAAAWQEMQDQLDYAETVAGIRKGLTQARAGNQNHVNNRVCRRPSCETLARKNQSAGGQNSIGRDTLRPRHKRRHLSGGPSRFGPVHCCSNLNRLPKRLLLNSSKSRWS